LHGAAQVIGIDVEPDGAPAFGQARHGAARAQRFGQHHRDPAVQQAVRLLRAAVDRHPGADEVVADFEELDAEPLDGGVLVHGHEAFDRNRSLPDPHDIFPV
jgi:hypothetical protein